jgi:hypothetical protein
MPCTGEQDLLGEEPAAFACLKLVSHRSISKRSKKGRVEMIAPSYTRQSTIKRKPPHPHTPHSSTTSTMTRGRECRLLAALLVLSTAAAQVSIPLIYKARPLAAAAAAALASSSTPAAGRGFLNFMTIGAEGGMAETEGLRIIVEKEVLCVCGVL